MEASLARGLGWRPFLRQKKAWSSSVIPPPESKLIVYALIDTATCHGDFIAGTMSVSCTGVKAVSPGVKEDSPELSSLLRIASYPGEGSALCVNVRKLTHHITI